MSTSRPWDGIYSETELALAIQVRAEHEDVMNCRSCGAPIVWLKTATGKPIPVDRDSWQGRFDEPFNPDVHVTHFRTCPNADQHRRRKPKKEQ